MQNNPLNGVLNTCAKNEFMYVHADNMLLSNKVNKFVAHSNRQEMTLTYKRWVLYALFLAVN